MSEGDYGRDLIESRLDDAIARAERGCVSKLLFLTPRERKQAERILRMRGALGQAWFWGGYPAAERVCLFLLPDYLLSMLSGEPTACEAEEVLELLGEEATEAVSVLRIKGSGYRALTHRDHLGSILGLGLERDALGDIAVQNQYEAVVFCSATIARFLCTTLTKVANDTVKCCLWELDGSFSDGRAYQPIYDTVASARLDCVVAALTDLSRDDAQSTIKTGRVEVDFEPTERVDLLLDPPVTISIRGFGRFVLCGFDGETRKGRMRMKAEKLIDK